MVKEYLPRSRRRLGTGRRPLRVVDNVDIQVHAGESVALVGESGAGKTTVARMLSQLERPTSGRIWLGEELLNHSRRKQLRDFRQRVQVIFQNPYESLDPRHSVQSAVIEPLNINRIGTRQERHDRVLEVLELAGLTPAKRYLDRFPHELSGGQRQRVSIARALAMSPSVLVADEPVSMLDASVRSSILNLLTDLRSELGLALLFVTHDLATARHISDRLIIMYRGQVVESGPTDEIIARPAHPYTQMLLAAAGSRSIDHTDLVVDTRSPILGACQFAPRCPLAKEVCWSTSPPLEEVVVGRQAPATAQTQRESRCLFALDVFTNSPMYSAAEEGDPH